MKKKTWDFLIRVNGNKWYKIMEEFSRNTRTHWSWACQFSSFTSTVFTSHRLKTFIECPGRLGLGGWMKDSRLVYSWANNRLWDCQSRICWRNYHNNIHEHLRIYVPTSEILKIRNSDPASQFGSLAAQVERCSWLYVLNPVARCRLRVKYNRMDGNCCCHSWVRTPSGSETTWVLRVNLLIQTYIIIIIINSSSSSSSPLTYMEPSGLW